MRKSSILITILFLTIGFATISTSLIIRGSTRIGINENDFNVYFSDVKINGVQDLRVVTSDKELTFSATMKSKNEMYVLDYDVTNGSKNYDAKLEMICTGGNDYLSVNNVFDTNNNLLASETRSGKLTITLEKQNTGESLETEIKCTIIATGVERTELDAGTPADPVEPLPPKWNYTDSDNSGDISKGDLIDLVSNENEKFNVISVTEDTVTMLAKYTLDQTYRQSETGKFVTFLNSNGWEYTPGPKEIDIQSYDGNVKTYVNEYVSYLQDETGDTTLRGNLITLAELKALECTIMDNYSYNSGLTCVNSSYKEWLVINKNWWTRSAYPAYSNYVWSVATSGNLSYYSFSQNYHGVRPTITISKDSLNIKNPYKIGNEITIDTETFNVISSTEDTVTLLAQYDLGTNYRQTTKLDENYYGMKFSNSKGWEYTPGPKEIDIQAFDGNVKTYVNEYVSYLQIETGTTSISGNLITLAELKALGCTINDDYSWSEGVTCETSEYVDWLGNGQTWWTRSAATLGGNRVWYVFTSGIFYVGYYDNFTIGVRPVITISKETYDRYYND